MKVSYIYWQPWFGALQPGFNPGPEALLTLGYAGVLAADVVVAHAPSLFSGGHEAGIRALWRNKPLAQVWILESFESAANYPRQFEPSFRSMFDAESSYRQGAEIWVPYLAADYVADYRTVETGERDGLCCAFVSSGVNQSRRNEYMEALMDHMEIASFGRFRNNRQISEDKGKDTKLHLMKGFRYSLAFENAIEADYVTEKFFEPLMTGTIPVYLGAPNIAEFAPGEDCYIDASAFPDPAALADFLCHEDPRRFHQWRMKPLRRAFLDKLERSSIPFADRFMAVANSLGAARRRPVPEPARHS